MNDTTQSWKDAEPSSKPPVPDEKAIENIRASAGFEYPILTPQPTREGSAIFVAAGPTVRDYVEEIRRRKDAGEYIFTCNHMHDWLVERGIIPNACLIFDPKEEMKDAVKLVQPDTAYMIATCVDPKVWEEMGKRGARMLKVMVVYGMDSDRDMELMKELYPNVKGKAYLPGGTMTPLRAMPLAAMLGFKKMEMYGFDSCYSEKDYKVSREGSEEFEKKKESELVFKDDKGRFIVSEPEEGGFYYAYKKFRIENIKEVEVHGRVFLSSTVLIHQAMQLEKWYDRLESQLEIVVHGDNLSSWVLNKHKEELAERKRLIGDRRWTDHYADQMRQMHEAGGFGIAGYTDIEWSARALVSMICTLQRPITVLDYGAGAGTYAEAVHKLLNWAKVTSYDPFHPKFRDNPEPGMHDVVNCTDVMEHVEYECIDNTLKFIADKAKFMACFSIGTNDAVKVLPDGRNAHITQKSARWWADKLREHFVIVDVAVAEEQCLFICQHMDAEERLKEDGAYERNDLGGRLMLASKVGGK